VTKDEEGIVAVTANNADDDRLVLTYGMSFEGSQSAIRSRT